MTNVIRDEITDVSVERFECSGGHGGRMIKADTRLPGVWLNAIVYNDPDVRSSMTYAYRVGKPGAVYWGAAHYVPMPHSFTAPTAGQALDDYVTEQVLRGAALHQDD